MDLLFSGTENLGKLQVREQKKMDYSQHQSGNFQKSFLQDKLFCWELIDVVWEEGVGRRMTLKLVLPPIADLAHKGCHFHLSYLKKGYVLVVLNV